MCGPPHAYMEPPYEHEEHGADSSDTSDTDKDENHNTRNALLEALTMPGTSPAIQQSLEDWGYAGWHCRNTLRWTSCTCPWNGKQGSDCQDAQNTLCEPAFTHIKAWQAGERLLYAQPHCEKSTIRNGNLAVRQEAWRLEQCWTKAGLGPSAPRTGSQFCLCVA